MDQVTLILFLLMCSLSLGTFPLHYNHTVTTGEEGACPTATTRSQIVDDIDMILRSNVTPVLQVQLNSSNSPFLSCSSIPAGEASDYYWIQTNTGSPSLVYCDMTRTSCCSTTGGWMRVADLDMTDTNQQCPSVFRQLTSPIRACGRPSGGCVSTTFQTHGIQYSKVCGKIIGYQQGLPDAFHLPRGVLPTINDDYVDGVSLTHGQSPRQHIWTFAAAFRQERYHGSNCPCAFTSTFPYTLPSFIGQDYFCESGSSIDPSSGTQIFDQDPLWNGQGCISGVACCTFNNPPWFCKQLPQPTSDDIELRLCGNEGSGNEDTLIESVELYIQ